MKLNKKHGVYLVIVLLVSLFLGTPSISSSYEVLPVSGSFVNDGRIAVYGVASWYSESDPYINLHTANGEVFDDSQLTCASWDYPFDTFLKVTNLSNDRSVVCRVNDRGPARRLNRLIDLTKNAFRQIANLHAGLIEVQVTPLKADSFFNASADTITT